MAFEYNFLATNYDSVRFDCSFFFNSRKLIKMFVIGPFTLVIMARRRRRININIISVHERVHDSQKIHSRWPAPSFNSTSNKVMKSEKFTTRRIVLSLWGKLRTNVLSLYSIQ